MKTIKNLIDEIWEVPIFYKFLQATLAGGGHFKIKQIIISNVKKSDKKILDQGCGTGEYSLLFPNRYYGIDNSKADIEYAFKNFQGNFTVGDASKLPYGDNFFDFVYAVGLHHHLTEIQAKRAVKESLRVTKKGGRVLVVDAMLPKNSSNIIGLFLRKMDRGKYVRPYNKTLELLPRNCKYSYKIISSFPFDYITIKINK